MSWSSYNPETTHFDGLYFRVNWSGKVDSVEVNSGLETSKVRLMYRVQGSPIQIKIQPFRKPVKKFNSTDHMPKRTQTFKWSPASTVWRLYWERSRLYFGTKASQVFGAVVVGLKGIRIFKMYEMNQFLCNFRNRKIFCWMYERKSNLGAL